MSKIYCLNPISKIGLKTLNQKDSLTDHIQDADGILVRSANMHDLKLSETTLAVARAGAGVNNIPLDLYARQGIVVFNTPGANANAVKEIIIAGMLLAARDIYGGMYWLNQNQEDQEIAKTVEKVKGQFGGTEIFGKTIGIVGLGAIGSLLANTCHALGMKVYGAERNMDSIDLNSLPDNMSISKSIEAMLPYCDYVSLNIPLMPQTKHFFNKEMMNLMKDGAVLLNFARDALVNDADLKIALETGKMSKYVTDFPNAQTVIMKGVIAIPHLGASTEEAEDNCAIMAINQLSNYIDKGFIKNSVNFPDLRPILIQGIEQISILYDVKHEVISKIKAIITIEGYHVSDSKNDNYGAILLDLPKPLDDQTVKKLTDLEGILRIRKIQKNDFSEN